MLIQNVTRGDLESALDYINEYWEKNIFFSTLDSQDEEGKLWLVTLHCVNVKGPGHMLNYPDPWADAITSVCWHVRHTFFLELPNDALMKDGNKHWISRSDDQFPTWVVRGKYKVTDLCECVHSKLFGYHHSHGGYIIQQ